MKQHDKSGSAEIAEYARTTQHIEPEDKPMKIHVIDYAERKPVPIGHTAAWWLIGLTIVCFLALVTGVLVFVAGML